MTARLLIRVLACTCAAGCAETTPATVSSDVGEPDGIAVDVAAADDSAESDVQSSGPSEDASSHDTAHTPEAADVPESTADAESVQDAGVGPGTDDVTEDADAGGEPEDVPPPPLEPTLIQANTTWEVTAELLLEGEFVFAWDPAGQDLVAQVADGGVYFSVPGQVTAPLEVAPGWLRDRALVPQEDETPLQILSADEGLFVRVDETLVLSPLDALLPSAPTAVLASGDPMDAWLWLSMVEGLWVFHDGAVYAVEPDEVDVSDAAVTFGAPVDGVSSLWGVNAWGTWALSPDGEGLSLTASREGLSGTAIAADTEEHLWVVDDLGDLHERGPDGTWAWWRLPESVGRIEASTGPGGVWLEVGDALWFRHDGDIGPLESALDGDFLGVDSDGRALVAHDGGLWAVAVNDVTSTVVEDPPTWSLDIEPIFVASCAPCHGKGAYAHPIYEPEQWIVEIDQIIFMVTEPAWEPQMPLAPYPALDNEAVQAIMDWRDAGFPE